MFNVALCDDDPNFLEKFEPMLHKAFSGFGHEIDTQVFLNGKSLIRQVEGKSKSYDLIFLDVAMPELDGFATAEKLRRIDKYFRLIFTTYMTSQARRAFKYNAFRYVDKDSLDNELQEAVKAYLQLVNFEAGDNDLIELNYVLGGEKFEMQVAKSEIILLEVIGGRVWAHTIYGEYELQTYRLKTYVDKLGEENFIVLFRKYCVNMMHIQKVIGDFFQLTDNRTVCYGTTGKAKKEALLKFSQYRNERISFV